MKVKGHNGSIEFDGQFVTITREGFLARMAHGKGEKRIAVRSISAVQLKPPNALVNGFIQFTLSGGSEKNAMKGNRTMAAGQDENSVLITKQQLPEFEALRAEIEQAMVSGGQPAAAVPDLADQLAKLAQLRDQGILSEAEFEAKKADILGRM